MNRQTRQRETILKMLKGTYSHPTADQVYDEVRKDIPNISKGTVYRNLGVLQKMGLVSELDLSRSQIRFETKREAHYHFQCKLCGRVYDLEEPVDGSLDERVSRRTGFKVAGHQTEFRGLCKTCQNQD